MSAFDRPTRAEAKRIDNFIATGDFNKPKPVHRGNWTLYYDTLTWPESTNKPIGVIQNHKKTLLVSGYPNKDKFKLKPA